MIIFSEVIKIIGISILFTIIWLLKLMYKKSWLEQIKSNKKNIKIITKLIDENMNLYKKILELKEKNNALGEKK